MKEQIIKTYEADYKFFLSEAARCTIEKNKDDTEFGRAMNFGMIIAFKSAAYIMYSRLNCIAPNYYPLIITAGIELCIEQRVAEIIKEKSDHEQKTQPLS